MIAVSLEMSDEPILLAPPIAIHVIFHMPQSNDILMYVPLLIMQYPVFKFRLFTHPLCILMNILP